MTAHRPFNSCTLFLFTPGFLKSLEEWGPRICILNKFSRWLTAQHWEPRLLCLTLRTKYSTQAVVGFMTDIKGNWCIRIKSPPARIWMFVTSQNSYIESLTPKVIVLQGEAFACRLRHESGVFVNGIRALIKEAPPWGTWVAELVKPLSIDS